MDKHQLRELVKSVLHYLEPEIPYSENAVELLMLTAAQESHLGKYIKQMRGPASGIMQMEPATEADIWDNYLAFDTPLRKKIKKLYGGAAASANGQRFYPLHVNLAYQIAMARVHYRRVPTPLPRIKLIPMSKVTVRTVESESVDALATYWKKYYNTPLGKGTVEEARKNYRRYVTY